MLKRAVIIGGGINGCVAANYLCRNGYKVSILDRRAQLGGACSSSTVELDRRTYSYASGATVLGMMQDFVFEQTGLGNLLNVYAPQHPSIVNFESLDQPTYHYADPHQLADHLKDAWGETGDVEQFTHERKAVSEFLIAGYKNALVPSLAHAEEQLGETLTKLWISGTAKELLDHYFTSDRAKMFFSIDVTESGPLSIHSPFSAFAIPLMSSGTVFNGDWGFVKGSIANVCSTLADINAGIGVRTFTGTTISSISCDTMDIAFHSNEHNFLERADLIIFATDPLVAATLTGQVALIKQIASKQMLGTSGKLVMFFQKPVKWKNHSGLQEFDSAFRFVISTDSPEEFEKRSREVESSHCDYTPGYFEIYCEGAGRRQLGENVGYDTVAVFFKNLALNKRGKDLAPVQKAVEKIILKYINNPDDLIGSLLLTPKDIQQNFFISQGHIDHVELCQGQTFFDRNYSSSPYNNFYQFGQNPKMFYCGSGAYPGGSVSGTAGYMCAQQIMHRYS